LSGLNDLITGNTEETAKKIKAELQKLVDAYASAMQTCSGAQCALISQWYLTAIAAALYLSESFSQEITVEQAKKITVVCNEKKIKSLSFHQRNPDCCWAANGSILYRFKNGVERSDKKKRPLKEEDLFYANIPRITVSTSLRQAVINGRITNDPNAISNMSRIIGRYRDGQKMNPEDCAEFYIVLVGLDVYSVANGYNGALLRFCMNSDYGPGLGSGGNTVPLGFLWAFFCAHCINGIRWKEAGNANEIHTVYLNKYLSRDWFERILKFHVSNPLTEQVFTYDFVKNKLKKGPFIMNVPYVLLKEAELDLIQKLASWSKNPEEALHFVVVYGQKVIDNKVKLCLVNTLVDPSYGTNDDPDYLEIPFDDFLKAIRLSKGSLAIITT
jgi:hypothetical protein